MDVKRKDRSLSLFQWQLLLLRHLVSNRMKRWSGTKKPVSAVLRRIVEKWCLLLGGVQAGFHQCEAYGCTLSKQRENRHCAVNACSNKNVLTFYLKVLKSIKPWISGEECSRLSVQCAGNDVRQISGEFWVICSKKCWQIWARFWTGASQRSIYRWCGAEWVASAVLVALISWDFVEWEWELW